MAEETKLETTTDQPQRLATTLGSALAEQRNALAEARLRIIARIEDNKRWGDPLDQEAGLQAARRIIGAMWDELPVPQPKAVIDHEAHMRRVIEEQNKQTQATPPQPQ